MRSWSPWRRQQGNKGKLHRSSTGPRCGSTVTRSEEQRQACRSGGSRLGVDLRPNGALHRLCPFEWQGSSAAATGASMGYFHEQISGLQGLRWPVCFAATGQAVTKGPLPRPSMGAGYRGRCMLTIRRREPVHTAVADRGQQEQLVLPCCPSRSWWTRMATCCSFRAGQRAMSRRAGDMVVAWLRADCQVGS